MMNIELNLQQANHQAAFRQFANTEIAPGADQNDGDEHIPVDLIRKLAERGYLGSLIGKEWGGRGWDSLTYGLLNEEIGRACSSVRSLLTVHDMVSLAILKWGSAYQRDSWLPKLTSGEQLGALAVTEPTIGSDATNVETTSVRRNGCYVLNGRKKWITCGQIANLFLVLAQCDGKPTTFLVERNSPGLSMEPINGMLGVKASMLAQLTLENCEIPSENLLGRVGFGFLSSISTALDLGRYSVAWGCVGIAQACLEASVRYTSERKQFGVLLKEHQLIRQMMSEMVVNVKAARLLCHRAGYLKDAGDPRGIMETFVAKYFASRAATKAAADALQIHGANGCSDAYPVARYLRDAKIMEIIEGSNQIQQLTIADCAYQEEAWRASQPLSARAEEKFQPHAAQSRAV